MNAGVGYGVRTLYWETSDNRWVKNSAGSYSGLAIDAGLMGTIKNIIISAGVTVIQSNIDLNIGVGYAF